MLTSWILNPRLYRSRILNRSIYCLWRICLTDVAPELGLEKIWIRISVNNASYPFFVHCASATLLIVDVIFNWNERRLNTLRPPPKIRKLLWFEVPSLGDTAGTMMSGGTEGWGCEVCSILDITRNIMIRKRSGFLFLFSSSTEFWNALQNASIFTIWLQSLIRIF